MSRRVVQLWSFCSVKGGVGKSALAVATAAALGLRGRRALVIDADLTGTSLADGLDLLAPVVTHDGSDRLLLAAPATGQWHDRASTVRLRDQRAFPRDPANDPVGLPFINDILAFRADAQGVDCRIDALVWKGPGCGVSYLPSSSIQRDVEVAVTWMREETRAFSRRFAWILSAVSEQIEEITDVLIDLPPGPFGLAHAVLWLLSKVQSGTRLPEDFPAFDDEHVSWSVHPHLVTSQDHHDLYAALEYWVQLNQDLPGTVPVVNRRTLAPEVIRASVRSRFASGPFALMNLEDRLKFVDELRTSLGRLFLEGSLPPGDGWSRGVNAIMERSEK